MTERTAREQYLRNEVGQLTHKMHSMAKQRAEMQADLIRQRDDMQQAISLLEAGRVRDAVEVLRDGLAYRERNREPRRVRSPSGDQQPRSAP
jgi:hypothetical protein